MRNLRAALQSVFPDCYTCAQRRNWLLALSYTAHAGTTLVGGGK
jgi:hypothetical protein